MAATDPTLPTTAADTVAEAGTSGATSTSASVATSRAEGGTAPAGARLAERIVQLQPFREAGDRAARTAPVVVPLPTSKSGEQLFYRIDDAQTLAGLDFDPARVTVAKLDGESARLSQLAQALTSPPSNTPPEAPKLASVSSILPSYPPAAPLLEPTPIAAAFEPLAMAPLPAPVAAARSSPTFVHHVGMLELAPGFAVGLMTAVAVGIGLYYWLVS